MILLSSPMSNTGADHEVSLAAHQITSMWPVPDQIGFSFVQCGPHTWKVRGSLRHLEKDRLAEMLQVGAHGVLG